MDCMGRETVGRGGEGSGLPRSLVSIATSFNFGFVVATELIDPREGRLLEYGRRGGDAGPFLHVSAVSLRTVAVDVAIELELTSIDSLPMLEKLESGVWFRDESKFDKGFVVLVPRVEFDPTDDENSGGTLRVRRSLRRSRRLEADRQWSSLSPPPRPRGASSPPSIPLQFEPQLAVPIDPRLDRGVPRGGRRAPCILAGAEYVSAFAPIEALRSSILRLNASRSGLPSLTRVLSRPNMPPFFGAGAAVEVESFESDVCNADVDCVPCEREPCEGRGRVEDLEKVEVGDVAALSSRARSWLAAASSSRTSPP